MIALERPRVEDHVELVFAIARAEARRLRGVEAEDLVTWGFFGLRRACRTFDGRGSFTGYASSLIRFEILDGLRAFFQTRKIGKPAFFAASFDDAGVRDRGPELVDVREDLAQILRTLSYRERYVLERHVVDDETLAQVGAELGVSESRTCQLEKGALEALRRRFA